MLRFRLLCYLLLLVLSLSSMEASASVVYGKVKLRNEGVVIGNLDDGHFLYANKRYYNFSARYRDARGADSLQVVGIAFSDGLHWVNATLDLEKEVWTLKSGEEVASINSSLCSYRVRGDTLKADFFIMLNWNISDHSDLDIYQFCSDYLESTGWVLTTPSCADIVSTLILEDLEISDDRGNTGQEIAISGRILYMSGLSSPEDEEIERISILNSEGVMVAEAEIEGGYFKAIFNAPEMVGKESYSILIEGEGLKHMLSRYVLEFDGVNDYLEIIDPKMEMEEGMTIEIWFNPEMDRYQPLIQRGGWRGYYLRQNPGGGIYFLIRDDRNSTIIDEKDVYWFRKGEWTHLAVVVEFGGECKVFINGELKARAACNVREPNLEGKPLMIGCFNGDIVRYFNGRMDEIRIYSRPLTSEEIRASFLKGRPSNRSGLVLWLPLDEGEGEYANDVSGWGNRAELGGLNASREPLWIIDDPLNRSTVSYIADELEVHLKVRSKRIDVSKMGEVEVYALRRFDGTLYDGVLELNDTSLFADRVMKRGYTVRRAYGGKYNITKIGINDEGYIIWDKIVIKEGGASEDSVKVGEEVTIWVKAEYEYDGKPFTGSNGILWMNGTMMKWSPKRMRWEYNTTSMSRGRMTYMVSGIHDLTYNITTYIDEVGGISVVYESVFITTELGILTISLIIIFLTIILPLLILRLYESLSR